MKERKIEFSVDTNSKKMKLTDEQKNGINKTYNDIGLVLNEIKKYTNNGELEIGYSETLMSSLENYTCDMLKHLNYSNVLEREKEERYTRIRSLNEENRELRKQLGEKVSNEDVREKVKNLYNIIRDWYNDEGFEYISDPSFDYNGTFVGGFSCYISGVCSTDEELKEKIKKLINYGFVFDEKSKHLLLNTKNIDLFQRFILERFPSATFGEIDSRCDRNNKPILNGIKVYISNLDEL